MYWRMAAWIAASVNVVSSSNICAASQATRGSGRFGVVVPALARMAQQCDVERQPEAVLRAPACTGQIKIIIGQKIVALQRSDVGGNPE